MKHIALVVVGAVLLGGLLYAVLSSNNRQTSGESIKIGVSSILSGDLAAFGENPVNAARIAIAEVNANGGINGRPLELVLEDAGCDSKTGLSAAQKLINVDKARYIIGATCSNGTLAAAPLVNENKVIYMTPVTGGANVDHAGEYVFRVANGDLLAGRDLAHAALRLGFTRVAVVAEVTEYTLDIKGTFESTMQNGGGTIVASEEFQPGTTDFRTLVAKVGATSPDAILVLSQSGLGGAHFVKQAKEAGITVPFFSDFTFLVNEDAKNIVGSFEGIYFADPAYDATSQETKAFLKIYEKQYHTPPLIAFHALSTYDSVMMLADALRAVGDDSTKVHDWLLTHVKNRTGLMGTYSLDAEGNSDLGFVIKVVRDGKPEIVSN